MNESDESDKAFEKAISEGRLSDNPKSPTYADWYMYMGKDKMGKDMFKHRDMRNYIF